MLKGRWLVNAQSPFVLSNRLARAMAKVIRQKQVELQAAIVASGEVKLLASKMNAAGLMSNKDHDEITGFKTWWTDGERAESVVKILRNKVDIKPSNLEKFKDILKSKSEFEDILDLLETTAPGKC